MVKKQTALTRKKKQVLEDFIQDIDDMLALDFSVEKIAAAIRLQSGTEIATEEVGDFIMMRTGAVQAICLRNVFRSIYNKALEGDMKAATYIMDRMHFQSPDNSEMDNMRRIMVVPEGQNPDKWLENMN